MAWPRFVIVWLDPVTETPAIPQTVLSALQQQGATLLPDKLQKLGAMRLCDESVKGALLVNRGAAT